MPVTYLIHKLVNSLESTNYNAAQLWVVKQSEKNPQISLKNLKLDEIYKNIKRKSQSKSVSENEIFADMDCICNLKFKFEPSLSLLFSCTIESFVIRTLR